MRLPWKAKWYLTKLSGGTHLSETDYEDAKAIALGQPIRSPQPISFPPPPPVAEPIPAPLMAAAPSSQPVRRWLHASIDEFISHMLKSLDPSMSNGDHIINTRDRVMRALEAQADIPLEMLERKELDEWILAIKQLKSKCDGKSLGPATVRKNLTGAVRLALTKFVEWKWWTPPPLWENAFNPYTIKKLETPAQRKRRRKRPSTHNVL